MSIPVTIQLLTPAATAREGGRENTSEDVRNDSIEFVVGDSIHLEWRPPEEYAGLSLADAIPSIIDNARSELRRQNRAVFKEYDGVSVVIGDEPANLEDPLEAALEKLRESLGTTVSIRVEKMPTSAGGSGCGTPRDLDTPRSVLSRQNASFSSTPRIPPLFVDDASFGSRAGSMMFDSPRGTARGSQIAPEDYPAAYHGWMVMTRRDTEPKTTTLGGSSSSKISLGVPDASVNPTATDKVPRVASLCEHCSEVLSTQINTGRQKCLAIGVEHHEKPARTKVVSVKGWAEVGTAQQGWQRRYVIGTDKQLTMYAVDASNMAHSKSSGSVIFVHNRQLRLQETIPNPDPEVHTLRPKKDDGKFYIALALRDPEEYFYIRVRNTEASMWTTFFDGVVDMFSHANERADYAVWKELASDLLVGTTFVADTTSELPIVSTDELAKAEDRLTTALDDRGVATAARDHWADIQHNLLESIVDLQNGARDAEVIADEWERRAEAAEGEVRASVVASELDFGEFGVLEAKKAQYVESIAAIKDETTRFCRSRGKVFTALRSMEQREGSFGRRSGSGSVPESMQLPGSLSPLRCFRYSFSPTPVITDENL